jgi:hypothetical protein
MRWPAPVNSGSSTSITSSGQGCWRSAIACCMRPANSVSTITAFASPWSSM